MRGTTKQLIPYMLELDDTKIYELRKKYNISSVSTTKKNRYGHYCTFSTYVLEGEK